MGVLCKKTLGAAGGGLIHITFLEHGPDTARRLINNLQVHGVCVCVCVCVCVRSDVHDMSVCMCLPVDGRMEERGVCQC